MKTALLCSVAVLFTLGCAARDLGPERPNVVLLVIDTLRHDRLSSYGYAHETSPFLDELADAGVRFTGAYSPSSWTSPATAALMTSTYPFQSGVVLNLHSIQLMQTKSIEIDINRIPDEAETLAEMMKRAGYLTYGLADNINVSEAMGFEAGFDLFRTEEYVGAEEIAAIARSWGDELRGLEDPYFLYLHFMDPHVPYHRKQPWFDRFVEERDDVSPEDTSKELMVDPSRPNPVLEVAYDSEIRYLDETLRALFADLGLDENTLLIVVGDHGEEFWEHGKVGHGSTLYDELIRVPMLVYGPGCGVPGGRVIDGDASLLDVIPTIAERLDIEPPAKAQGRSFWSAMRKGKTLEERTLYAHLVRKSAEHIGAFDLTLFGVLTPEYKFLHSSRGEKKLFDRANDPAEKANLSFAKKDRTAEFTKIVKAIEGAGTLFDAESAPVTLDSTQIEHLKALGYID